MREWGRHRLRRMPKYWHKRKVDRDEPRSVRAWLGAEPLLLMLTLKMLLNRHFLVTLTLLQSNYPSAMCSEPKLLHEVTDLRLHSNAADRL